MTANLPASRISSALRNFGISLFLPDTRTTLDPTDSLYGAACAEELQKATTILGKQSDSSSLSPSTVVRTVVDFARRHGLAVRFRGVSLSQPNSDLATLPRTIFLGIGAFYTFHSVADLQYGLEHEWGHVLDKRLIDEELAMCGEFSSEEKSFALLRLMQDQIPDPAERARFDALAQEIFGGGFDQNITRKILAETLRFGEEIRSEGIESRAMRSPARLPREEEIRWGLQRRDGTWIDMRRLLWRAAIESVPGLWQKVSQRSDFEETGLQDLNPRYVEFFRMAIQAASRYFSHGTQAGISGRSGSP